VPRLSADPDDDQYVACAIAGRATFLVTGDPDLLDLRQHAGIRITTPREFVSVLRR
jgi:predicted nucleic acid-binding protein